MLFHEQIIHSLYSLVIPIFALIKQSYTLVCTPSKPRSKTKMIAQVIPMQMRNDDPINIPIPPPEVQSPLRILVCPSGFKESLDTLVVADCIEKGIKRVLPNVIVQKAPLFDGGEGFAHALVATTGGELRHLKITGPVNIPLISHYGILGGDQSKKTAVVEMAAAAGLRLVPKDSRDPTITTTYGVGELMRAALDEGVERLIVGCGDSGTNDGGAGMLQALGAHFFDIHGNELAPASGGAALCTVADIDLSGLHPRLKYVEIEVACNCQNILCGPKGVARVYGPQKGATPAEVELLDTALNAYASAVSRKLGRDISTVPGSGASGGMGTGLLLLGAKLRPRYEAVTEYFGINDDLFRNCHLVFTAEGRLDSQTPQGKIPAEVALRAKKHGLPVIALAGTVGPDAAANYLIGIDAFASIMQGPIPLEVAIADAERLLTDAAESVMRVLMLGQSLRVRDSVVAGERASLLVQPPK
ncbi:glycerate kinase [Blastomyces dermatitidis ER-3]|uniref:Glycerate kinase n=2 Tax=Ajellomyces dermatitidis TaxID=5039 RepID=F2TKE9_AJEDA|nr:glycerate kinase [Blastomyces dermatitidis ER-3]EEQ90084.2 glycerate kinase [Blastomyces dermatitidis ER-3]EGE83712.2 glycerate kinase [Blastomyces dermatitidis ATCC 18188]EQL28846.1 glycerate kinase [Blastomyces dermatitidis ATCC 26199]